MNADPPSRPRGRPRRFDERAALDAAERLFGARGYAEVGVAELCRALGLRPPSLYAAWGSKLGLFEATLERYAEGVGARFAAAIEGAADRDALWRALLGDAARLYTGGERRGCLALESTGSGDADVRDLAARHAEGTRRMLAARLAALGVEDAETEARALLVALRGVSAEARAGASTRTLLRAVEALVAGRSAAPDA